MSIEGKKLAIAKAIVELELVKQGAHAKFGNLPIVGGALKISAISPFIYKLERMSVTPHQYFSKHGKIDKRKVKRHDRKLGTKSQIMHINQ